MGGTWIQRRFPGVRCATFVVRKWRARGPAGEGSCADLEQGKRNADVETRHRMATAHRERRRRRIGALLGLRIIEIGRNTTATITPAIALNMVF